MKINKWSFFGIFILYSVISIISFVFTSGGWTAFIFILPGSVLLFVICIFVLLIANLVSKNKRELLLSNGLIYTLVGAHILTILFNVGDCGDGSGSFQFIQVLMGTNGWSLCNTGREALMSGLSPILFLVYILVLLVFLVISYRSSGKSEHISGM